MSLDQIPTKQEFEREWMSLQDLVLAVPGEVNSLRKAFRNWTDRGIIEISNPNPGTNEKRMYSLKNAVEATVMLFSVSGGNTLKSARLLADRVISYSYELIASKTDLSDLRAADKVLLYWGDLGTSHAQHFIVSPHEIQRWLTSSTDSELHRQVGSGPMHVNMIHVDYLIWKCIDGYRDLEWHLSASNSEKST